jgi:hypothetical protein
VASGGGSEEEEEEEEDERGAGTGGKRMEWKSLLRLFFLFLFFLFSLIFQGKSWICL